jgi:quercetin dioxygenase-like cupin family protein
MKIYDAEVVHNDHRGEIIDILVDEEICGVSCVTFSVGAIRGNHIHEHTSQWNYIFRGKVRVSTGTTKQENWILDKGKVFLIEPGVPHAMKALEETTLFVYTLGVRTGKHFEDDTIRLSTPLLTPDSQ